jgi:hypothetical protein
VAPGYQLLCKWTRHFNRRALEALPTLLAAFVMLQCGFQHDLGEALEGLTKVPERAYALALALGLWRAIREASGPTGQAVSLEVALPSLVEYLGALDPASHGLRRDIRRVPAYDASVLGGRPPPDSPDVGGK